MKTYNKLIRIKYNGKLYDTVTPTERDITLSASFSKLK